MQYVGFWARVGAEIIDGIITSVVGLILMIMIAAVLPEGLAMLVSYLVYPLYSAYFISSQYRATPGKMAIGAVVVKPDGASLSFLNALGRSLAKYISAFILLIGFIMVAFTEKKQGLHDMIANTVVVKKDSVAHVQAPPANPMSMGG